MGACGASLPLFAICLIALVAGAPPRPTFSSYSLVMKVLNDETYDEKVYYDATNSSTRFDNFRGDFALELYYSQIAVAFNSTSCTTYCAHKKKCSEPGSCQVPGDSLFDGVEKANYTGTCATSPASNQWTFVRDESETDIYCITDAGVPLSVTSIFGGNDELVTGIANFTAGPQDPSLFAIPKICPCIN